MRPLLVTMVNEGFFLFIGIPYSKCNRPGGDWNSGGSISMYTYIHLEIHMRTLLNIIYIYIHCSIYIYIHIYITYL